MPFQLIHGDCLDALRNLPDSSVDAVVTDPPAGISFMGRAWDGDKGGRDLWIAWLAERLTECLRVLKPGGHAVVWALPRTSGWTHRALEDAGFDVRDCVHHLFGSGFPKSLDVGKAIDKAAPRAGMFSAFAVHFADRRRATGLTQKQIAAHFPSRSGGLTGCVWNWENGANVPTLAQWELLAPMLALSDEWEPLIARVEAEREVIGTDERYNEPSGIVNVGQGERTAVIRQITAPATPEAQQWDGWGTALKPAVEHWWLARKPLDSTVAGNVTRWGTGALNIAATRVGTDDGHFAGRWPADVVLSHTAECNGVCSPGCAVAELDQQSGTAPPSSRVARRDYDAGMYGPQRRDGDAMGYTDTGGASRYFATFKYQAKPSTREKSAGLDDRNTHPTVKPVELMSWLIRLVTPPGGTVLDCFAGSGSTLVAATLEGFDSIGVEAEAEYLPLIEGRVRHAEQQAEARLF